MSIRQINQGSLNAIMKFFVRIFSYLTTIIHLACYLVIFPFLSLVFLLYRLVRGIYYSHFKIVTVCTNCYKRATDPTIICPKCGKAHATAPQFDGFIFRRCSCGKVLRVSPFSLRKNNGAVCCECCHIIKIADATLFPVSVVGAPKAGKSFLIDSLVGQSEEKGLIQWHIRNMENVVRDDVVIEPRRFCLPNRAFWLYEIPGCICNDADRLKNAYFLDICTCIIFVIDSSLILGADPETENWSVMNSLIIAYEAAFNASQVSRINKAIAIYINDPQKHFEDCVDLQNAETLEGILREKGYSDLLNKIKTRFLAYKFFVTEQDKSQLLAWTSGFGKMY